MSNADNSHTEKLRRLRQTTQAIFYAKTEQNLLIREQCPGGVVFDSTHQDTKVGSIQYYAQKAEGGVMRVPMCGTRPTLCAIRG